MWALNVIRRLSPAGLRSSSEVDEIRIEEIPDELWHVVCAREVVIRALAIAPHPG
jgi:hypothetical protein